LKKNKDATLKEYREKYAQLVQEKFYHYYERFCNHDRAQGFAVKGLDKVQQTMKRLHDEKGYELTELKFLEDCQKWLVSCRKLMKWS
jgi:hypothetical protein